MKATITMFIEILFMIVFIIRGYIADIMRNDDDMDAGCTVHSLNENIA